MLPYLLVLVISFLFYHYAIKPMSYWKSRGVRQTNPIWFFGDTIANSLRLRSAYDVQRQIYDSQPNDRYIGYYEFTTPALLVKDVQLLKQMTIKNFEHFMDHKPFFPLGIDPFWDKNLLASQGAEWKKMRPILSPVFTSNKLKIMYNLMNDCTEKIITFFQKKNLDTVEMNMKDVFSRFTNDVIASTAFGVSIDSLEVPNNEIYKLGQELTQFTFLQMFQMRLVLICKGVLKIMKLQRIQDPGRSFFANLLEEAMKTREEKGIVRPDIIQLMMEAKKKANENGAVDADSTEGKGKGTGRLQVTNDDIIANSLIFLFAGFESVSTLITFMAYELAVNQEVQQRLRQEIEDTVEACEGNLTYDALFDMKYLDMVVSETLRKWPSFVTTDRICTRKFTIEPELPHEKPVTLEKGTIIEIPIMSIQRDSKYFPDPERFNPERFSDENKDKIESGSYLPFGLGPRYCIGNRFALIEAKIFFAHILRAFEIVPTSKTRIPIQMSKNTFNLYPEGDVTLGFKRYVK